MRKILMILACCVALVGCGTQGNNKYQNVVIQTGGSEIAEEIQEIDGFERAEFEKFNSYASENGLKDTPIFVEGTIYEKTIIGDDAVLSLKDRKKNNWAIVIGKKENYNEQQINDITGKRVRIFGFYGGYSETVKMPAIHCEVDKSYILLLTKQSLYETENLITKSMGDIEYQIPESWDESANINGDYTYYYDDGLMIMVYIQEMDEMKPFEKFSDNEKQEYKEALLGGMKKGFESYEEIDDTIHTSGNGVCMFRYHATVELQGEKYVLNMLVIGGEGKVHEISFLVNIDSQKDYVQEFEDLRKSVKYNAKPSEEKETILDSSLDELKTAVMNTAKDFEVTDENSAMMFEIVIKMSKEVSKCTSENFAESELFSVFSTATGYLCRNFDKNTEYGRAGELAFELIQSIARNDENGKQKVISAFEILAENNNMEIQTLPDKESEQEDLNINDLEPIDLSTGKYIVGEDIPAGKYDIIGVKRGNIYVSSNGGRSSNELIESIVPGEIVYVNMRLKDGYEVEVVSGGKVQLQPK